MAAETARPRDDGASLRLTAAALRLGEFTVRELSEAAQANYETARDFVARRRQSSVLVPVDETQATLLDDSEESSAAGRPPRRYKISENQRNITEKRIKAIRGSLADVARASSGRSIGLEGDVVGPLDDEAGPLGILERAVRALSHAAPITDEDRQARIVDIEILRAAAERDVKALAARSADRGRMVQFSRRLGAVTGLFEELKQASVVDIGAPASEAWRHLVDELVLACRGHWAGGVATAKAIDQFVILLDGIPIQQDPVTSGLLRSCVADAMSVVFFETKAFRPSDWQQMRDRLHLIQMAAPSVVRAMFVAVDGRTEDAWSMVEEVSLFDKIQMGYDLASPDSHVGSILRSADNHRGGIFCLDLASEPDLSQRCEAAGINYVAHAASATRVRG